MTCFIDKKRIIRLIEITVVTFCVLMILSVAVLGQNADDTETLIFARPGLGETGGFDPVPTTAESGLDLVMVYNQLTTMTRNGKVVPELAVSWEVSRNFKEWIFHLREGVTFHNGKPLTAQAVKYTFDRYLGMGTAGTGIYANYATEDTARVVDKHTIKFVFKKPFALFAKDVMAASYSIVEPTYVQNHATDDDPWATKWMHDHSMGTGPYKLGEWIHGQRIVFHKFKHFWGKDVTQGKNPYLPVDPAIETVVFKKITDPSVARMSLEAGDVDVAEKLRMEQFVELRKTPGIKVVEYTVPKITYLTMDVRNPPFDSVKVRKAIAYAINYRKILQYAEMGFGKRLHGLMSDPIAYGSDPELKKYDRNIEKAKKLLADSGYANGFKTQLIFNVERRSTFKDVATLIQTYLRQIGIKVELKQIPFSTQLELMKKGDYGLSLMVWSDEMPDPEDVLGWLADSTRATGGWNGSHWYNQKVVEALEKGRAIANWKKRKKLYRMVNRKVASEAIYIPLYQVNKPYAMKECIHGFFHNSTERGAFWAAKKECR